MTIHDMYFNKIILFNITFLAILFMIHIYVTIHFIKRNHHSINCQYKELGIWETRLIKHFKEIAILAVGFFSFYKTTIGLKEKNILKNNLAEEKKNLLLSQERIIKAIDSHEHITPTLHAKLADVKLKYSNLIQKAIEQKAIADQKTEQVLALNNELCHLTPNTQAYLDKKAILEQELQIMNYYRAEANRTFEMLNQTSQKDMNDYTELDLPKPNESFIGVEYVDWFHSLDVMGKLSVSLFFLNYAILQALSSIVVIFYGEYLLKKFKIEEKFPRLSKFISLRRKFQAYYLFSSVSVIFLAALTQITFAIWVLTLNS
jgi:hypothetical protein